MYYKITFFVLRGFWKLWANFRLYLCIWRISEYLPILLTFANGMKPKSTLKRCKSQWSKDDLTFERFRLSIVDKKCRKLRSFDRRILTIRYLSQNSSFNDVGTFTLKLKLGLSLFVSKPVVPNQGAVKRC